MRARSLIAAVALALAACGHRDERKQAPLAPSAAVVRVTANATVELIDPVALAAPAAGRIDFVFVDEGVRVEAGTLLATIIDAQRAAAVEHADAAVRQARARARQAVATRTGEAAALATMKRAAAVAVETRARARRAEIRAPINGTVYRREVMPGATVGPDAPLFTIARNVTGMQLVAEVDEDAARVLTSRATVTFTVPAWPDRVFAGKLVQVREAGAATYDAIVELSDPGHTLRRGMSALVTFTVVGP